MRYAVLGALVLASVCRGSGVVLPFQDSALDAVRRGNQCPRTQPLHAQCDNDSTCCQPGYGCNMSGQGNVGQVCVKRESGSCSSDDDCGSGQSCIFEGTNGKQGSYCAHIEAAGKNEDAGPTKTTKEMPMPTLSHCTKKYTVKKGDTCVAIIDQADNLTLDRFYSMNPSVNNPSCNNLQIGQKYCVDAPPSTCMRKVAAKKGDTCLAIIGKVPGLTLDQFYQLNPDVHKPSCDNLQIGQKYCVDVPMNSSMMGSSSMLPAPSSMLPAPSSMMISPSSMVMAPSSSMLVTPSPSPAAMPPPPAATVMPVTSQPARTGGSPRNVRSFAPYLLLFSLSSVLLWAL